MRAAQARPAAGQRDDFARRQARMWTVWRIGPDGQETQVCRKVREDGAQAEADYRERQHDPGARYEVRPPTA